MYGVKLAKVIEIHKTESSWFNCLMRNTLFAVRIATLLDLY